MEAADPSGGSNLSHSGSAIPIDDLRLNTGSLSAPPADTHGTSNESQLPLSRVQLNPNNGPQAGSFHDTLPHGHTSPQPIDADLLDATPELSDSTQNALAMSDSSHQDSHNDSGPDFQSSGAPSGVSLVPRSTITMPHENEDSTITVASQVDVQASPNPPSAHSVTQSAAYDQKKQYVLPNGSLVSGKGLGRGRPGIKRGPRSTKRTTSDDVSSQSALVGGTSTSSEATKPPTKRRKSGNFDSPLTHAQASTTATTPSRVSSEEYNPTTTQTRSGRHTQRPIPLASEMAASASPSRRPTRPDTSTSASPATVKAHPKIKRRVYRGREQFALCEHCQRGHGPPSNVIVFCDACNKCWHQRCHDPNISKQTISDTKAEWFCATCDRILHGAKKGRKLPVKTNVQTLPPAPITTPPLSYDGPRVGGRLLDPAQKSAYLGTLSKDDLVSLLLEASNLAPDLPLFKRLVPASQLEDFPQAQFTSTYVTPVSKPPAFADKDTRNNVDAVDEGYDDNFDDHAALYPKPGNGVQLPPDSEDLHILLEGKDSKTFSHWVRGMKGKDFSGTGNIIS
ncbi:hypothetical protein A1O1_04597 [Capronia coronata CBS 617.96]|uniref:PHD-type domain-containing protein n=1 Tax=Capronia coronata CBS 617.96 TaxID=1182541 RepID=W9Y569_9EURO|nr:uncharacterized protein A1O1_04597 [Capronia coronata CBS 617.96]EXJ87673.1 hypothetical protein A1O1_04597 [Capronia coronata CBS 617.96]